MGKVAALLLPLAGLLVLALLFLGDGYLREPGDPRRTETSTPGAGATLQGPASPSDLAHGEPRTRREEAEIPAGAGAPNQPVRTVRLVVQGLRPGCTARVVHSMGEVTREAEVRATPADPSPSLLLPRLEGEYQSEKILVEAEGFGKRGIPLDPEVDVDEVTAYLIPEQPLVLEFPGLAGHLGSFEVLLEWVDPPEAAQFSGVFRPMVFMDLRAPLDASGSAVVRGLLFPSRPALTVLSLPRTAGLPVAIYRASLHVQPGQGALVWPGLTAHEVSFRAPESGRPFELLFRPDLEVSLQLPDGAGHFGWTNAYGMHAGVHMYSDGSGRLELLLPPTISTLPSIRYLGADQPAQPEGEGWEELRPFLMDGPGPIQLER